MRNWVTAELAQSNCAECGAKLDRATGPDAPSPGDFTVCIDCANVNVFTDALEMRKPTLEEAFQAANSRTVQQLRGRILQVIKMHEGKKNV